MAPPVDPFARDRLPPAEAMPELVFDLPELHFPARLNCATELLDRWVATGHGHGHRLHHRRARAAGGGQGLGPGRPVREFIGTGALVQQPHQLATQLQDIVGRGTAPHVTRRLAEPRPRPTGRR